MTQAAAATMQATQSASARPATAARAVQTLEERLEQKLAAARKYRGTVAFFKRHRSLLSSSEHQEEAARTLVRAERRVAQLTKTIAKLRRSIRVRKARLRVTMSPKAAICNVFGGYCDEAVAVAWCESRLRTSAQNGQYRGLFQMGAYERQLFGHGQSAHAQARAAHRYFVQSGRDWSPWSCRWAAR